MASADEDGHLVELASRLAAERARLAEMRQRVERASGRARDLQERGIRQRLKAADQADLVADTAEWFAAYLEAKALGDPRDPRLKVAQREREIAALERRNAARLRETGAGPLHLERPPPLHDNPEVPDTPQATSDTRPTQSGPSAHRSPTHPTQG